MNRKTILFFVCVIAAVIISFVAIPLSNKATRTVANVVRVVGTEPIPKGTLLKKKDLQLVEVGAYGLAEDVAKTIEGVEGLYAMCELYPGDNITQSKVSATIPKDETLLTIERGTCAVSISVKTLSAGLSGKLQAGDVVSVWGVKSDEDAEGGVSITLDPLMQYMEVLSVTNTAAASADANDVSSTEESIPATVTFRCTPNQAAKLIQLENVGTIHIAFVGRTEDAMGQLAAFNESLAPKAG